MLILTFPDYLAQSQRLAARLEVDLAEVVLHYFPDGESLVRLPSSLPEHVVICRSLNQPNDKLIELMLCAKTARELGAKRLTLIAPYLCYMRQDIANQPGEAVSQRIIGKMLADLFDDVITVDPHLHRISTLNQAIPIKNAISLTATNEIGQFLKMRFDHALLLGPDGESEQWVSSIANSIGFDYVVGHKERSGDKSVEITLPEHDYSAHPIVIIDDIVSTGRTLGKAAKLLQAASLQNIYAFVTHPLFCNDAEAHILKSGVKAIWSTDSINHRTSFVKLDTLFSTAVKALN